MARRSAVITGAATGLGADLAHSFLKANYHLTLVDVNMEELQSTAAGLWSEAATRQLSVQCHRLDVCDFTEQQRVMQQHVRSHGSLDVVVLNAGIAERGPFFDPATTDWQKTLDIDLTAVMDGARCAGMIMSQQPQGGTIFAMASAGGIFPMPAAPVYAAAKAGVIQFVRSAGPPLAKQHGVRLIAVCPEFVDTPLVRDMIVKDPVVAKKTLGSLDISLLQPAAVSALVLQLLADPQQYRGGAVALLRQNGSVEFPFKRQAPRLGAAGSSQRQPSSSSSSSSSDAAVSMQRQRLASWAVQGLSSGTYRKLQVTRLGTAFRDVTHQVQAALPPHNQPPAGCLLLRRVYVGINASDINYTAGRYHNSIKEAAVKLPFDCGFESVNVVMAVGQDVKGVLPGDVVACMTYDAFSEVGVLPAHQALPVPAGLLDPRLIALLTSGLTASIALEQCGRLVSGNTVLVTAAAGGTGQFAVQLARQAGCHVIATAGGKQKAAFLKKLGAHRVIDYKTESLKEVLKSEYPKGVDVVYESVGGDMFDTSVNALAMGGRLIIIGMMSQYSEGWPAATHKGLAEKLLWKSASLHGFFLLRYVKLWRQHLQQLIQLMLSGQLYVAVDARRFVGLSAVPDAVDHLQSGASMGKVVVQLPETLPETVSAHGTVHSKL